VLLRPLGIRCGNIVVSLFPYSGNGAVELNGEDVIGLEIANNGIILIHNDALFVSA